MSAPQFISHLLPKMFFFHSCHRMEPHKTTRMFSVSKNLIKSYNAGLFIIRFYQTAHVKANTIEIQCYFH